MPKVNVYLSDELAAQVRKKHLPMSQICQMALQSALDGTGPMPPVLISVPAVVAPEVLRYIADRMEERKQNGSRPKPLLRNASE